VVAQKKTMPHFHVLEKIHFFRTNYKSKKRLQKKVHEEMALIFLETADNYWFNIEDALLNTITQLLLLQTIH